MKVSNANRGQFVIIAVLLAAIMIVSIGAVMHNASTYYKSEPWEEYTTLVGNIELNSKRLLALSLESYVETGNSGVFEEDFDKWKSDLLSLYPSAGINLRCTSLSFSTFSARATFSLDINSIGLKGYKFTAQAFTQA